MSRLEAAPAPRVLLAVFVAAEGALLVSALLYPAALPLVVAALAAPLILVSVPRALAAAVALLAIIPLEANRYAVIPFGLQASTIAAVAIVPWAALLSVRLAHRDLTWRRTRLDLPVAALLAAAALAAARGAGRAGFTYAFKVDVVEWSLFGFFFVATQGIAAPRTARRIWGVLVGAAVVVGIEFLWVSLGAPHGEFGEFSRVTSYQSDLFALALPALAAMIVLEPRRLGRRAAVLLVPVMIGLLLAQVRSLFVAGVAALATVLAVAGRRMLTPRRLARLGATIAVAGLLAFLVIFFASQFARLPFSESLRLRSEALGEPGRSPALAIRLITFQLVWSEKISREPIWGHGLGDRVTFPEGLRPYREYGHVDNAYVTVWWKLGLPGLAAFLWVLTAAFTESVRVYRRAAETRDRTVALGAAGTIAALAALGLATVVPAQLHYTAVWAVVMALPAILAEGAREAGAT